MRILKIIWICAAVVPAGTVLAQTTEPPPRFDGTRARATSDRAEAPEDGQRRINSVNGGVLNSMIGAAALEAARREGLRILDERTGDPGVPGGSIPNTLPEMIIETPDR